MAEDSQAFNDEIAIRNLLSIGANLEDARNWSVLGCADIRIPGKFLPNGGATHFNLLKVLELTIYNGLNLNNNFQPKIGSGSLSQLTSYEQFYNAFIEQLDFYVSLLPFFTSVVELAYKDVTPTPFLSSLLTNCIKEAKDITFCNENNNVFADVPIVFHGIVNVGNSLTALKKLIFEEKLISPYEIEEALRTNFFSKKGKIIRETLINKAPKYGNDDDEVDTITKEVFSTFVKKVRQYKSFRGYYGVTPQSITGNVPQGSVVGATPDGRIARSPNADNVSPYPGTDKMGPTFVIKSVAKLDHELCGDGTILNMKFNPTLISGSNGINSFIGLIRTFFDLGGYQIQFNIISAEKLRKAKENPSEYKDLIIKVAGYSTYFVSINSELQDQIIARTEYGS